MKNAGLESIVNCPICGEQVMVVLKPYREVMGDLMKIFEGSIGVGKTEHFEGSNICKCGRKVTTSIHVTAEAVGGKNGNG